MHVLALAALLIPAGDGQQKQAHPGYPPMLALASASEQGGKVVIQIARVGVEAPPVNGKDTPDPLPTTWLNLRKVTLGETVQAFDVDGKPAAPKTVLKALAEPKGVAVFLRSYANDPLTPAPFYRALLREGTIILVLRAEDLYYPKP